MDYVNIGSVPYDEDCCQVGDEDYFLNSQKECRRFIELIRTKLGPEPYGARLSIKGFPHDFGTYYEVVCYYNEDNETAVEYAFNCEANAPAKWEEK